MTVNLKHQSPLKILAAVAVSFLTLHGADAAAENIAQDKGPCGTLTAMGANTSVYNNSRYDWKVIFKTRAYHPAGSSRNVNAGAVKYLSDAMWIDSGVGDYRSEKIYTVPVGSGQAVPIAYCADTSLGDAMLFGQVLFEAVNDFEGGHGYPGDNVEFRGINVTPQFWNHGYTPYVDFNKKPKNIIETGSLTICPKDVDCRIP